MTKATLHEKTKSNIVSLVPPFRIRKNNRLREERRLFASELRALDRETQTQHVLQRKDFLSRKVPEMEKEMYELQKALQRMLASPTDQLNPSGKYYVLAEKLVKV